MASIYDSAVASVCEFTGLDLVDDRDLVVSALKEKNGSIEAVVAAFYDDEHKFRASLGWNETLFSGDREDAGDKVPAFNVQGPDEMAVIHGMSPSTRLGAPSRPPSRTQSPLGRMGEWASQLAPVGAPASRAQEDSELHRALAESAALSNLPPPQETGVTAGGGTDMSLPFFGPANREAYDPNQWAMVRAAPESQELDPSARKRTPGTPAFLRSRSDQQDLQCLNAVLSILHAIPSIRNAFLRSGRPAMTYGQNPEWWKGSPITPVGDDAPAVPPYADANVSDSAAQTPIPSREVTDELHRLVAFLDGTSRAFGTADTFINARLVGVSASGDSLGQFFNALVEEAASPELTERVFSEIGLLNVTDINGPPESESYALLDAKIEKAEYVGELKTVYNVLDALYWMDLPGATPEFESDLRMAVSTRLGHVQIFNMNMEGFPDPLDIPEFFYPDRYMAENRELALATQLKLRSIHLALRESDEMRTKIVTFHDKTNNVTLSQGTLSEEAIGLGLQKLWQLKASAYWKQYEASIGSPDEIDFNLADVDAAKLTEPQDLVIARAIQAEIAVHRKQLTGINKKLQRLRAEKVACERLLARIRRKYTEPEDGWQPTHRYRLRGVIPYSDTYYLCRRETAEQSDMCLDGEDQWWRISVNAACLEPVSVEKTTVAEAREAAFEHSRKAMVIYASDDALEEAPEPLSDALRTFVRFDDRFFKQEVEEESRREKKRQPTETPTSPPKRQQRSNSIDSMATNKASVGELSDRCMDDVPLIDDTFGSGHIPFYEGAGGGLDNNLGGTSFQEVEYAQTGSLGTEMVQLAISRPGGIASADLAGPVGADAAFAGTDSMEEDGPDTNRLSSQQPGHLEQAKSKPATPIMASWDNPEGRYMDPSDVTKQ